MDHATDLIARDIGLAVLGPAGVGKSRVIHEVAARISGSGRPVLPVVASASTRSIPFAPFVDLLPPGPTQDELMMLAAARAGIEQRAGDTRVVIAVDDAHQLDRLSLAFLISIIAGDTATVLMSARTGELMDPDLVDLWTNGVIERVDLGPLTRSDVSRLLERRLGPVAQSLEDELWELSRGNPLVLHEMVEGAIGASLTRNADETWRAVGPIAESPRLADLVRSRLGALPEHLRSAMDLVAVGAPIPLPVGRVAIGDDLAELEDRRLVEVTGRTDSAMVVPAHPLYGEILHSSLGEIRRHAALRSLVAAAADVRGSNPDPLRAAVWQRDLGEIIDPAITVAGAAEALSRHDPDLSAELLEPLDESDDRVAVLMGRSLSYRQRFAEAEALLAGRTPTDQHLATEMASIRGQNLAFGLGRIPEARSVFEEAASSVGDPDLRARLANERAMVSAVLGDFDDAMAASESVLSDPVTSDTPRAAAYVTLTIALAMTADCNRFDEIVDDARATAVSALPALAFAPDQVEIMWAASLTNAGHFDRALEVMRSAIVERQNSLMTGPLLGSEALFAIESGQLRVGLLRAEQALAAHRRYDPFGLLPQSLGLIGLARGQLGEVEGIDDLEAFELAVPSPRLTIWMDRGRAWCRAAGGQLEQAAEIVAEGGRAGVAGEHFAWAAMCFHDAVRFGRPALVIDDLRSIDTSKGARYLAALQDSAEALLAAEPVALEAIAVRFGELGTPLLMAEALARASRIHHDRGALVEAARACAGSKLVAATCDDATTPALVERPESVSDRESQVAGDAAIGLTSPQIAKRRFISVRTVDNHLRSVYRKLDVSGRDELAVVLGSVVRRRSPPADE